MTSNLVTNAYFPALVPTPGYRVMVASMIGVT